MFICFILITLALSSTPITKKAFTISSPSFNNQESLPKESSKSEDNESPELEWENAPKGTKSFALIMTDPDASKEFTHWLAWNIPYDEEELDDGQSRMEDYMQGTNDFGNIGYDGPSPPNGVHRYFITLYALDKEVKALNKKSRRSDFEKAIQNSILGKAVIMGTYAHK
jgi:Raf kinase inhibitor-like YbhB/YbcL family protein